MKITNFLKSNKEMESKQNKNHKKNVSNKKDKKIKTFSSCFKLNDNQS